MLYMLLCCFLMLNSTFVMFRAMSAISKGSATENRSEILLIVLATLGIASPFIVAMITINESMTSKTVTDFSLGAQWSGMVSAVALMGLYARRVWKEKKSLFTGAFLASSLMAFIFTDSLVFVSQKDTGVLATFVLDKNAGDIDCSRPAMIVHYSKGVPTDWRCPTSIMLMAYSSSPFLPWPEYSHGTSQSLTVVIDTFMENAVNLSKK
ncbi:TPA: hypothetical protein I8385_005063 [Citrobacter freundii]|uniref:hypothetical protein n=1 Tax=Enterobacterales TaxID=91347 RepID=UPI0003590A7C|nr:MULTISPECIES: hypothetical protein [Enterobacterales]EAA7946145.1 hypothetical protein [Salmonella enterica]EBF6276482.1 hypothetical protein [Salmonella enterica subsp. enterica serovar Cubana]ECV2562683.1 hypothetical protein [Salmonella enterica subsp. enterica serovar Saintpaul]MDV1192691.1 hypothetical protein [Raoultella planticola]HAT2789727.1 hypothetical protein [Citrobacter freundii]HDW2926501.1 hypothetical protein [Escherichia coli]